MSLTVPLSSSRAPRLVPPGSAEPVAFVADALAGLRGRASDTVAVITAPAPLVSLEAALAAAGDAPAMLWQPPSGPGFVGAGVAAELVANGRDRVAAVARAAESLWPRLCRVQHPAVDAPAPRLWGGLSFAPGAADAPPWSSFGDARFVLPRWCYGRDGARAWITLAVEVGAEPDERARLLAELAAVLGRLSGHGGTDARDADPIAAITELSPDTWREQIETIRRAIVRRRYEKVVAARCTTVEMSTPIDPGAVLTRLASAYPDCYRFAFRPRDAAFVGATPERLVALRGDRVSTEALAGSIAADGPAPGALAEAGRRLLASGKDRGEQALVVEAIAQVLAPLCGELSMPDAPEIRALRHVLHLHTPITGRLRRPAHVLELVAALHPTPAVGGAPTAAALRWIAEHEPEPRGWYAAPVGWFDAAGEGEFAVAIRSGVLRGKAAWLYTGAGIVRDSDPDAEYAETGLKQRALLGALGVSG
jgi:salicylate biosynthesis isochorismate synthase